VDKVTRRFIAASKDTAVQALSKNTSYDRADLVRILSVATVGETREYEKGALVYIPENPRDHPNLIRFYKEYHYVRYLETVIHGYPKHFSKEDVRAAPKTLPKNFIEFLLRRGTDSEIKNVALVLFKYLTNLGLEQLPTLTGFSDCSKLYVKNVYGFLTSLNKMGLNIGDKLIARIHHQYLSSISLFVEEFIAYERYMHTANAGNYNSLDAQRAAQLLAEGFLTTTPPDEPLTRRRLPDPNFPPTEVANVFEYYLYYGSDIEVNRVANVLINISIGEYTLRLINVTGRDFQIDYNDSRLYTRSDLQTILTFINPKAFNNYYEQKQVTDVLAFFGNRIIRNPTPGKDIREHPSISKYYKRKNIINYFVLQTYGRSPPLHGALLLDEIEAVCPANLLEHCLEYGTDKEIHDTVETLISKYNKVVLMETDHLVGKKNKGGLYTRNDLRLLLKILPQKLVCFDPNDDGHDRYRKTFIYDYMLFNRFNDGVTIKYISQKGRDEYISQEHADGDDITRTLIEGFGHPPYTKEQHRALILHLSGRS
jgi:hypothetical protein